MWGMIATWRLAKEGLEKGCELLKTNQSAKDAIELAIKDVEDNPYYKSVGYGGLPNEEKIVELDAAFMDGETLSFGAVGAVQSVKNPITLARLLSKEKVNNFLVGEGALKYAFTHGLKTQNMLSERAEIHYGNRVKEIKEKEISPYDGHDTVGMVALDTKGHMASGTSTSGLFMKKPGRIGDSPVLGSGLYVDDEVGVPVRRG